MSSYLDRRTLKFIPGIFKQFLLNREYWTDYQEFLKTRGSCKVKKKRIQEEFKLTARDITSRSSLHKCSKLNFFTNESKMTCQEVILPTDSSCRLCSLGDEHKICMACLLCSNVLWRAGRNSSSSLENPLPLVPMSEVRSETFFTSVSEMNSSSSDFFCKL